MTYKINESLNVLTVIADCDMHTACKLSDYIYASNFTPLEIRYNTGTKNSTILVHDRYDLGKDVLGKTIENWTEK